MEAEMGRRLGGQQWVPTARWPQAVPLSATTCELDTRCLLATRQIFYCCPHQLTSTANHCRQLPQSVVGNRCPPQVQPLAISSFGFKASQSAEHQVSSTVKSGCEVITSHQLCLLPLLGAINIQNTHNFCIANRYCHLCCQPLLHCDFFHWYLPKKLK